MVYVFELSVQYIDHYGRTVRMHAYRYIITFRYPFKNTADPKYRTMTSYDVSNWAFALAPTVAIPSCRYAKGK